MPNGGSDCCGTCWFNAKNKGETGHKHSSDPEPAFCSVRNLRLENPFYTYCGNHPHRRPQRDPIPIGPVFTGDSDGVRQVWQPSPDTEEIRQHLLLLLDAQEQQPASEYPIGIYADEVVVWQLGEFREVRATDGLRRIAAFDPSAAESGPFGRTRHGLVELAREALAKIDGGNAYFDMRNLASPADGPGSCPVAGCTATLGTALYRKQELPYCPVHRIRIHSRTFVYHHGPDRASSRDAALRNILSERQYFGEHILGHADKAESHRFSHETSEDAVTWNVFSRLARTNRLAAVLSTLTGLSVDCEPELYLWGLKIGLHDSSTPTVFPALKDARGVFERGIHRFLTEPDIMLYVPGELLVLVEAKFTSGNTVASDDTGHDADGEKPRSREGILARYAAAALSQGSLLPPPSSVPLYSQLYRNLVFAIWMADKLNVKWGLANLVSEEQFRQRRRTVEYQDPTQSMQAMLPERSRDRFLFYSWERLYNDHVAKAAELRDLALYMCNLTANGAKALAVECPE